MSFLISVLTGFKFLDRRSVDDDFLDRLHYALSTNILVALSILVSWKQFGGKPLECMPPDQYPGSWEQYVENYCWAEDTYHVPEDQELGLEHELQKTQSRVSYYKWVPFCLLFSAISFQLPYFMWKVLSHRSGVVLIHMIHHASDPKNVMPNVRPTTMNLISRYLENALRFEKRLKRAKLVTHAPRFHERFLSTIPQGAWYVTAVYLLVKVAYFSNALLNFILMNYFLKTATMTNNKKRVSLYGWGVFSEIINGTQWDLSGFFPRVTVCDFKARVMGFIQQYSIQCVLVINMFNEKIFIFLWCWYQFLIIISCISLLFWSVLCLVPQCRKGFILRHLEMADMAFDAEIEEEKVKTFVYEYLKVDGCFILRMLNNHTGSIFTSDLVSNLWKSFLEIEEKLDLIRKEPSIGRWKRLEEMNQPFNKPIFFDDTNLRYRHVPPPPIHTPNQSSPFTTKDSKVRLKIENESEAEERAELLP